MRRVSKNRWKEIFTASGDPCAAIWNAFGEQNVILLSFIVLFLFTTAQCGKMVVKNGV